MIRSLRKGGTSFEFWHKFGSDSLHAVDTEIELMPDHAVFRTTIKPVDGNQRMDADNIFGSYLESLYKLTCYDARIHDLLGKFFSAYEDRIEYVLCEIIYSGRYKYKVNIHPIAKDEISIELEK